jgi:hypothetical protein
MPGSALQVMTKSPLPLKLALRISMSPGGVKGMTFAARGVGVGMK